MHRHERETDRQTDRQRQRERERDGERRSKIIMLCRHACNITTHIENLVHGDHNEVWTGLGETCQKLLAT